MSVAQANEFINLCSTDEDLARTVRAAPDRAARESLAAARGYTFTADEMAQATASRAEAGELSDDTLAGVAGGGIGLGFPGTCSPGPIMQPDW